MGELAVSVIVPAFDEERALPATLVAINAARSRLLRERDVHSELVVVDNASRDGTARLAAAGSARVVREAIHNVGRVRNTGARLAGGAVLVWVDADTLLPEDALRRVLDALDDPACLGGAFDVLHLPRRRSVRAYLRLWRILGRALGMSQGATQFARRAAFEAIGGYDERLFMGEDVDLQWRLRRYARGTASRTIVLPGEPVVPSPRRFDSWPLWRTLVWTNPVVCALLARTAAAWPGWYRNPPR